MATKTASDLVFVTDLPKIARGRKPNPEVESIRDALAKNPGKWAKVRENLDAKVAAKFANALNRADGFEAAQRRSEDGEGYDLYARATVED